MGANAHKRITFFAVDASDLQRSLACCSGLSIGTADPCVCLSVCMSVCLCVCMCALQMPTTLLIESRRAFLPGQLATLHFSLNFHSLQLEHG